LIFLLMINLRLLDWSNYILLNKKTFIIFVFLLTKVIIITALLFQLFQFLCSLSLCRVNLAFAIQWNIILRSHLNVLRLIGRKLVLSIILLVLCLWKRVSRLKTWLILALHLLAKHICPSVLTENWLSRILWSTDWYLNSCLWGLDLNSWSS
jgi:hypothetical protein